MSVDVVEKLTPYLIDTRFSGILADRMMSDRDLRAPFFMNPLSSLSAKGTRPPSGRVTITAAAGTISGSATLTVTHP